MKFAITPCPNDTFTYFGLIDGAVESDFEFVFDDIENLNLAAENGTHPITKMSFAQYAKCADKYELLDAGAALGMGTGPVLVGRGEIDADCVFAVPGVNTTAALLLKHKFGKNVKMRPMHFRKIADAVAAGEFRAGVLIHEGVLCTNPSDSNCCATWARNGATRRGFPCRSAASACAAIFRSAGPR